MNKKRQVKKSKNTLHHKSTDNNICISGIKWHYSLITILLIIFILELAWGVTSNFAKIYSLKTKIVKLEKINKLAEKKNMYLHEEVEKYTSKTGVEALARDRLNFSKEDETLVIIKK